MKKLFAVLFAVSLIIGFTGMSMAASAYVGLGTNYDVGANYDANGYFLSGGYANSNVGPEWGNYGFDMGSNHAVAGVYSGRHVDSEAFAGSLIPRRPYQSTEVYGTVTQNTSAGVDLHNGNWANGGQASMASYYGSDHGCFSSYTEGNATTIGGTLAGAARYDTPYSSVGMAGAVTGSAGKAHAGCDYYDTDVAGNGSVAHRSYANVGTGQAWTNGSAAYNYSNDGYHNAAGAGFAATGGISTVNVLPNGAMNATAMSTSFSTSGPTGASGGTYISNMR